MSRLSAAVDQSVALESQLATSVDAAVAKLNSQAAELADVDVQAARLEETNTATAGDISALDAAVNPPTTASRSRR